MTTLGRFTIVSAVPYRHPAGGGEVTCRACGVATPQEQARLARVRQDDRLEYALLLCSACVTDGPRRRWRPGRPRIRTVASNG